MTSSYNVIRGILGPIRKDIRPLTIAIDLTIQWLFIEGYSIDDLRVTRDVYPFIGCILGKQPTAIARSVERLANLCWDTLVSTNQVESYFGKNWNFNPHPRDLILYFAFYTYFETPFSRAEIQKMHHKN